MVVTIGQTAIETQKGDITRAQVEAIVNAANNHLWMGGGVAGALKRAGGAEIESEAMAKGPVEVGEAVVTGAVASREIRDSRGSHGPGSSNQSFEHHQSHSKLSHPGSRIEGWQHRISGAWHRRRRLSSRRSRGRDDLRMRFIY